MRKRSRRSQMKIMEMSFMIIAIAIFFAMVALFWISISLGSLKENVYEGKREAAITLVSMLAGSPEFNCAEYSSKCVDADKILALKSHTRYTKFWGVDGLQIKKTYPYDNETIECTRANYPNCNVFTLVLPASGSIEDSSYVSICRKEYENNYPYDKCELGKISVFTKKTA